MFNYTSDVSSLAHYIIKNFCRTKNVAVDATLGNGLDTDFLSKLFNQVYSFEIQSEAIYRYNSKKSKNVNLINDSHEFINKYINEKVNCVMLNLGYLPGGNKNITTKYESTIKCIRNALELIDNEGIITIAVYTGHKEGANESIKIMEYLKNLPKNQFAVMKHTYENRGNNPPYLIVIEKR